VMRIQPLFPWLQSRSDVTFIKGEHDGQVLAIETLCWSRALGNAVVLRFGRHDRFEESLALVPVGSRYEGVEVAQEIPSIQLSSESAHFQGSIYNVRTIEFADYFDPPPLKKQQSSQ
jgi:hypothetical protein